LRQSYFNIFLNVTKNSFLGEPLDYDDRTYRLKPRMATPYDFLRKIEKPSSEYERLLSRLGKSFKENAKTEIYRKERGWIAQGISQGKIKKIDIGEQTFLVPILSPPAVGIDTSGVNGSSVIAICCFDNYNAGTIFLERHLSLPKAKSPIEYKWNKLDTGKRKKVSNNTIPLLKISSSGLLAIHTDVLISPVGSVIYGFRDLIEGCFSGYEKTPSQPKDVREHFRQEFFLRCNNTPIHCDPDFPLPLSTNKVVRLLVRTLSKKDGRIRECLPLHASLRSEESPPIQVADIIAGAIGTKIMNNEELPNPISHLYFDNRKINRKARRRGKFAKAYYWFNK
jgi:hypothetical protein